MQEELCKHRLVNAFGNKVIFALRLMTNCLYTKKIIFGFINTVRKVREESRSTKKRGVKIEENNDSPTYADIVRGNGVQTQNAAIK